MISLFWEQNNNLSLFLGPKQQLIIVLEFDEETAEAEGVLANSTQAVADAATRQAEVDAMVCSGLCILILIDSLQVSILLTSLLVNNYISPFLSANASYWFVLYLIDNTYQRT